MSIFKGKSQANDKASTQEENKHSINSAACWHYDRYESQLVQANRWLLAFWLQTGFSFLLVVSLCLLLPLKTLVPLIIRQNNQTHEVFVDKLDKAKIPDQSQTESDLVRYVVLRETYSLIDLPFRYKQILLLSNRICTEDYRKLQANANPDSPINIFGKEGTRSVHVEDIVFLNNKNNRKKEPISSLAKVDFVTTETINHQSISKYWVATISWEYHGLPTNKEDAWQNWNGFIVTYYRVDQRSIQVGKT